MARLQSLDELYTPQPAPVPGNTGVVPPHLLPGANVAQPATSTPVSVPPLGGPLPPTPVSTPVTMPPLGGPLPPTPVSQPISMPPLGGPLPPTPVNESVAVPPLGGPLPPVQIDPTTRTMTTGGPSPAIPLDPTNFVAQPGTPTQPGASFGPAQTVQDMLNAFLNGEYAQNARRTGMEYAAARGLMNSNIAAGASQRAALEAVQPFVSEGMNLLGNREQRAFQSQENQLERIQGVNNMILGSNIQERQMQIAQALEQGNMTLAAQLQRENSQQDFEFRRLLQGDAVTQQDWLASNAFSRSFNSELSMLPVTSSLQMMQYLMQLGAQDPEVYTPTIMTGMQNFFQQNLMGVLQQFFPNSMQPAPTGGTP